MVRVSNSVSASVSFVVNIMFEIAEREVPLGPYKPRTGRCMNHAPVTLAAPALISSIHRLLVLWIIAAHFHLCSLLDRHTILEVEQFNGRCVFAVAAKWGRCVLFINIWDSLTACCLVYNTAMYTVYGRCGQYGQCVVYTDPNPLGENVVHGLISEQRDN